MDGEAFTVERRLTLDRHEACSITDKHWYADYGYRPTGPGYWC